MLLFSADQTWFYCTAAKIVPDPKRTSLSFTSVSYYLPNLANVSFRFSANNHLYMNRYTPTEYFWWTTLPAILVTPRNGLIPRVLRGLPKEERASALLCFIPEMWSQARIKCLARSPLGVLPLVSEIWFLFPPLTLTSPYSRPCDL